MWKIQKWIVTNIESTSKRCSKLSATEPAMIKYTVKSSKPGISGTSWTGGRVAHRVWGKHACMTRWVVSVILTIHLRNSSFCKAYFISFISYSVWVLSACPNWIWLQKQQFRSSQIEWIQIHWDAGFPTMRQQWCCCLWQCHIQTRVQKKSKKNTHNTISVLTEWTRRLALPDGVDSTSKRASSCWISQSLLATTLSTVQAVENTICSICMFFDLKRWKNG